MPGFSLVTLALMAMASVARLLVLLTLGVLVLVLIGEKPTLRRLLLREADTWGTAFGRDRDPP